MKISSGNSTENFAHVHWGGAFFTGLLFSTSFVIWVRTTWLVKRDNLESRSTQSILARAGAPATGIAFNGRYLWCPLFKFFKFWNKSDTISKSTKLPKRFAMHHRHQDVRNRPANVAKTTTPVGLRRQLYLEPGRVWRGGRVRLAQWRGQMRAA